MSKGCKTPTQQQDRKAFFNNLGQDAQNKYAQRHVGQMWKAFFNNLGQDTQNKYAQRHVGQMWLKFELGDFTPALPGQLCFLHYKSMGKKLMLKVTLKRIVRSGQKWNATRFLARPRCLQVWRRSENSFELLWLSWSPPKLMAIQYKMRALLYSQHFLHYKSMGKFLSLKDKKHWN